MSYQATSSDLHPHKCTIPELNSVKMSKRLRGISAEKSLSAEEQIAKINDVKKVIGTTVAKFPELFSDESILRYLRAKNWSVKKAAKMLKETLDWRFEFKPEKLRWEDIAHEAQTGKIYKASYFDKKGRTVIVVRPGFQNTNAVSGQIKHLVYSLENALMNMNPDQEQLVWLVDFQLWTMASISVNAARETLKILQNYYPERLGVAIFYNPPKVFESFWTMMKPFIELKTYRKVNFVYSDKPQSRKILEELFDIDKLDSAFSGRNLAGFDYESYASRMKQEDKKNYYLNSSDAALSAITAPELQNSESVIFTLNHEVTDEDSSSSGDEATPNTELDINKEIQDFEDAENDLNPDKETQDQPCSCKGVKSEADHLDNVTQDHPCSSKDFKSEAVHLNNETQDHPRICCRVKNEANFDEEKQHQYCSCKEIGSDNPTEVVNELK